MNKYRGVFDASGITTKDKGISYDGRIEVMNNASEKGNEWIGYIDVQVKGTCVDEIKKGNSKFPIEVTHLENYTKNPLGVLFFVVQIQKDTLEKKIFYRYLLPVDLQKIFMTIKTTQETKSIDIYPIDSNQKNMLKKKCLEFLKARDMQVGKRIVILDETKQPLEVLVQDFRENKNDYLKDKVYMYVKLNDDEGLIPAIMPEGGKIGAIELINKPIILRGIKFYDSFKRIIEEDAILYQYGENIIFNTNTKKFEFKFQGTINEIINDIKFVLMIINITENDCQELSIVKDTLSFSNGELEAYKIAVSPLYDNGSSLCSYINEDEIDTIFRDKMKYNAIIDTKSKSTVGWENIRPIRHFDLIKNIKNVYYEETIDFVNKINEKINEKTIDDILINFDNNIISEKIIKKVYNR